MVFSTACYGKSSPVLKTINPDRNLRWGITSLLRKAPNVGTASPGTTIPFIMPEMGQWSPNHKCWVSRTRVQIKGSATPYQDWIFPTPTYTRGEANSSLICKAKISWTEKWKSFTYAWVLQSEVWPFEMLVYSAQMQKPRSQEMLFKRPGEFAAQVVDLVAADPVQFPSAVVTNDHKPGSLKQQKFILSHLWSLEVWNLWGRICFMSLSWLLVLPAILGIPWLPAILTRISVSSSQSILFSSMYHWMRAHPKPVRPHFN